MYQREKESVRRAPRQKWPTQVIGDCMKTSSNFAASLKWWYNYDTLPESERTEMIASQLRTASRFKRLTIHAELNFGLIMAIGYAIILLSTPLTTQLHYVLASEAEYHRTTGAQMPLVLFFLLCGTAFTAAYIGETLSQLLIEFLAWTHVMSPLQAKATFLARMTGAFMGVCLWGLFLHWVIDF